LVVRQKLAPGKAQVPAVGAGLNVNAVTVADVYRSTPQFLDRLCAIWKSIGLVRQFVLLAALLAASATMLVGTWVSERIKQDVLRHSAASSAVIVNSVVAPLVQPLAAGSELDSQARSALDALHSNTALGKHIVATKIWRTDGTVIYRNKIANIDETYPDDPQLASALNGDIAAKFIYPAKTEDEAESNAGLPLLGFLIPIREERSDRIIAIAQIYRLATDLERNLSTIRQHSWLAVGTIATAIIALLFSVVRSRDAVVRHERVLTLQNGEIARLRALNKKLILKLTEVRRIAANRNDEFLRRLGADLHNGPAQHVAFALLRIDALRPTLAAAKIKSNELEKLRKILQDSHQEIRNAARGLFFPTELEDVTVTEAVRIAVRSHEQRTETKVRCMIGKMPDRLSLQLQVCIYRFVQEGLSNAFRHASGIDQQVRIHCDGIRINIEITDSGPGCPPDSMRSGRGLGLIALRNRVESLGGVFVIDSKPGGGTRLRSVLFVAHQGGRVG
jgi:signal transduction histidine kinase